MAETMHYHQGQAEFYGCAGRNSVHLLCHDFSQEGLLRSTAFDGISYDFDVTILSDGSAAGAQAIQQANLDDMERVGIHIASCAEVAKELTAEAGLGDRSAVVL